MSIQKLIDDALKAEQDSRGQSSGKITPSTLGACYRRTYWKLKREPETNPIDARTLRVFKAGHLFHDFVQQYIPSERTEVKCETDEILGFADIVGKDTVYDIKSIHSNAFWYMAKDGYDVKEEKKNNWLQVACYAHLLKKPNISLVYISKDDLCVEEYKDTLSNWIGDLEMELAKVVTVKYGDKLPKAEPRLYKGKECKYCQFKDLCKKVEKENDTNKKSKMA